MRVADAVVYSPEHFKNRRAYMLEEFHREVNRLRMESSAGIDSHRAELGKIERRIQKIVELITEDDAPIKAMKTELRLLEERQAQLSAAIEEAPTPKPLLHPNFAEVYRNKVAGLQAAIRDPDLQAEPSN